MISGVDSSVILDVLSNDPTFADGSERILRQASFQGQLVVCECVLAEIYPAVGNQTRFDEFLIDWQLDFIPSSRESAALAGASSPCVMRVSRTNRSNSNIYVYCVSNMGPSNGSSG